SGSIPQAPSGVMKEKIFKVWLGNMNVVEFGAGGEGSIHDRSDQRSSVVRIDVERPILRRLDLAHARQSTQSRRQIVGHPAEAEPQQITSRDRCFQLLRRAFGNNLAVIDNGEAV